MKKLFLLLTVLFLSTTFATTEKKFLFKLQLANQGCVSPPSHTQAYFGSDKYMCYFGQYNQRSSGDCQRDYLNSIACYRNMIDDLTKPVKSDHKNVKFSKSLLKILKSSCYYGKDFRPYSDDDYAFSPHYDCLNEAFESLITKENYKIIIYKSCSKSLSSKCFINAFKSFSNFKNTDTSICTKNITQESRKVQCLQSLWKSENDMY